ncbi:MAG: rod-binding protein [Pseudomonadota bacterium]
MDNLAPDTSLALLNATQNAADNKLRGLKNGTVIKDAAEIDAVAKDFEAMFVSEMLKPMFEGIDTAPPFGGGKTEEVFKGLMLQEYGKMIAEAGQLGIADVVKAEMIKMQEAIDGEPSR